MGGGGRVGGLALEHESHAFGDEVVDVDAAICVTEGELLDFLQGEVGCVGDEAGIDCCVTGLLDTAENLIRIEKCLSEPFIVGVEKFGAVIIEILLEIAQPRAEFSSLLQVLIRVVVVAAFLVPVLTNR